MDRVTITGLSIETVIGVYDWERNILQTVVLDLEMAADNRAPARSDAIEDALDYAAVSARLIAFISGSRFQLIESLAEAAANIVRTEFAVPWVRLRVAKPGAVAEADAVAVIIERGEQP